MSRSDGHHTEPGSSLIAARDEDVEIVRHHLARMAQQITGSPLPKGPALAHRALKRIEARLAPPRECRRVYVVWTCPACGSQVESLPDDGEGMAPRWLCTYEFHHGRPDTYVLDPDRREIVVDA